MSYSVNPFTGSLDDKGPASAAPAASETTAGILEIATNAESAAGVVTTVAVPPSGLLIGGSFPSGATAGNIMALREETGGVAGNARGAGSVDFQTFRTTATKVASGANSVIVNGVNNVCSGTQSFVGSGSTNTNDGIQSFIGTGQTNTVSGTQAGVVTGGGNLCLQSFSFIGGGQSNIVESTNTYGVVVGGFSNYASGNSRACIVGGESNLASATHTFVGGGQSNTVSAGWGAIPGGASNLVSGGYSLCAGQSNTVSGGWSLGVGFSNSCSGSFSGSIGQSNVGSGNWSLAIGKDANAFRSTSLVVGGSGFSNVDGSLQRSVWVSRGTITTDATATLLLDNNTSAGFAIQANSFVFFTVRICGVKSDGSDSLHFVRQGQISNISGTTALEGSLSTIGTDHNDSGTPLAVSLTANNTTDCLDITVTGLAATTIRWSAVVEGLEIIYT